MSYSDGVKYTVFRILLMFGTGAVGIVFGKGLLWVISSVLPASLVGLKETLIDDRCGSLVAAATMTVLLGLVFYDDGKKHAAYEDWDALMVSITHIIMLMVYFVPVIFYNPNDITKAAEFAYYIYYFPCRWIMLFFGADIMTSAALGMALVLAVQLALYLFSYGSYKKKHPFSFKAPAADAEE